jgi:antirestriction protein ArdC
MGKSSNDGARKMTAEERVQAWQETITARIIQDLKEGVPTWERPWKDGSGRAGAHLPINGVTGYQYSGINIIQLWCGFMERGFRTQQWATWNQINGEKWRVKGGEKGTQIIFVKFPDKSVKDDPKDTPEQKEEKAKKRRGFLKVHSVFNFDQIEGIPEERLKGPTFEAPEAAKLASVQFVRRAGAKILFDADKAAYYPSGDTITMPSYRLFESEEEWAGTLFHEAAHWTGHKSRLNRDFGPRFNSKARAVEEIVVEISSAFTAAS